MKCSVCIDEENGSDLVNNPDHRITVFVVALLLSKE